MKKKHLDILHDIYKSLFRKQFKPVTRYFKAKTILTFSLLISGDFFQTYSYSVVESFHKYGVIVHLTKSWEFDPAVFQIKAQTPKQTHRLPPDYLEAYAFQRKTLL